jgi:NAD(P)-dependent dehydrogenase (short-subunit alcohol dehydrogenase family)
MHGSERMTILFPLWQIERKEYEAICAYLGLSPNANLYDRLSVYLGRAPFLFSSPDGFSRFLAEQSLTRFRVARLDFLTKVRFPDHPIRHVLNGVMALHECNPEGYREMSRSPIGAAVVPAVVGWGLGFAWRLAITIPYLVQPSPRHAVMAGRRVLVTGASRGLGLDIVLECLERGAEVVAVVRNLDSRASLRARLPAEAPVKFVVADLAASGALVAALRAAEIRADSIDMAVLCAGVKHDGQSVLELGSLRDTFEVNCFSAAEFAAWLCGGESAVSTLGAPIANAETAGPGAPAGKAAHRPHPGARSLVLISSIGRWHGMHGTCGYNASKAALSIWGESLDMELRSSPAGPITVTIVEPGMFESAMTARTALTKLLFVSRRAVARRIVSGALAGRKSLRPPLWFALLTWGVCIGGRSLRYRLFARVKPGAEQ